MNKTVYISSSCLAIALNLIFVSNIFAGGFDNVAIGSKAIGMGTAFIGIADDASAVYYNPGGMVFGEPNTGHADMYVYVNDIHFEYTEDHVTDRGNEYYIIPGLFVSKRYENWAFGFGAYVPFAGGGSKYTDFQRSGYDLEAYAGFPAFTPAVAYKLRPNLSVGMGLSVYTGEMKTKSLNENLPVPGVVRSKYDGVAGYGGHLGIMYRPAEPWRIGVTVRSPVPIEMDGEAKGMGLKLDSEVELTFPYAFSLGLGYQANPAFTFGLSVTYKLWGHMDEITIKTQGFGKQKDKTDYENSWIVTYGMEWRMMPELALRTGLTFIQGATEDKGLDPETLDVDQLGPTLGVAYNITDATNVNINCVYNWGLEKEYHSKKYSYENVIVCVGLKTSF